MATNAQDHELHREGKKIAAPHCNPHAKPTPWCRHRTRRSRSNHSRQALLLTFGCETLGSLGIATDLQDVQQSQGPPSVRFKSTIEEIAPDNVTTSTSRPLADGLPLGNPGQVTSEEIRELSNRLRACPLQERRMNIFSYEPVSLPASRVRILILPSSFAFGPSISGDVVGPCSLCVSRVVELGLSLGYFPPSHRPAPAVLSAGLCSFVN